MTRKFTTYGMMIIAAVLLVGVIFAAGCTSTTDTQTPAGHSQVDIPGASGYSVIFEQSAGGSITSSFGKTPVSAGTEVTFTVTPDTGCELSGSPVVTPETGSAFKAELVSGNTWKFTMPASSVKVTATFANQGMMMPSSSTGGSDVKICTVTFYMNDRTDKVYKSVKVFAGSTIREPAEPTRNYHNFSGWYADPACTKEFNFNREIRSDISIYANWTPIADVIVVDEDGNITKCDTFRDAVDAAAKSSSNHPEIILLTNQSVNDGKGALSFEKKSVVLNFYGNTLTFDASSANAQTPAITVKDVVLTLNNSRASEGVVEGGIVIDGEYDSAIEILGSTSKVILQDSVEINAGDGTRGITQADGSTGANVAIDNGSIYGNMATMDAISLLDGNVTMNAGDLSGPHYGIFVKKGTVVVNGGHVTGNEIGIMVMDGYVRVAHARIIGNNIYGIEARTGNVTAVLSVIIGDAGGIVAKKDVAVTTSAVLAFNLMNEKETAAITSETGNVSVSGLSLVAAGQFKRGESVLSEKDLMMLMNETRDRFEDEAGIADIESADPLDELTQIFGGYGINATKGTVDVSGAVVIAGTTGIYAKGNVTASMAIIRGLEHEGIRSNDGDVTVKLISKVAGARNGIYADGNVSVGLAHVVGRDVYGIDSTTGNVTSSISVIRGDKAGIRAKGDVKVTGGMVFAANMNNPEEPNAIYSKTGNVDVSGLAVVAAGQLKWKSTDADLTGEELQGLRDKVSVYLQDEDGGLEGVTNLFDKLSLEIRGNGINATAGDVTVSNASVFGGSRAIYSKKNVMIRHSLIGSTTNGIVAKSVIVDEAGVVGKETAIYADDVTVNHALIIGHNVYGILADTVDSTRSVIWGDNSGIRAKKDVTVTGGMVLATNLNNTHIPNAIYSKFGNVDVSNQSIVMGGQLKWKLSGNTLSAAELTTLLKDAYDYLRVVDESPLAVSTNPFDQISIIVEGNGISVGSGNVNLTKSYIFGGKNGVLINGDAPRNVVVKSGFVGGMNGIIVNKSSDVHITLDQYHSMLPAIVFGTYNGIVVSGASTIDIENGHVVAFGKSDKDNIGAIKLNGPSKLTLMNGVLCGYNRNETGSGFGIYAHATSVPVSGENILIKGGNVYGSDTAISVNAPAVVRILNGSILSNLTAIELNDAGIKFTVESPSSPLGPAEIISNQSYAVAFKANLAEDNITISDGKFATANLSSPLFDVVALTTKKILTGGHYTQNVSDAGLVKDGYKVMEDESAIPYIFKVVANSP